MSAPEATSPVRFDFAFSPTFRTCQVPLTITPSRCFVDVGESMLLAQFGFWKVETPLANISCVEITGPYSWWKVLGAPRLSMADNGITFATTGKKGVCIEFHDPVPSVYPIPRMPHPGLTVTVADPAGLHDLLVARIRSLH